MSEWLKCVIGGLLGSFLGIGLFFAGHALWVHSLFTRGIFVGWISCTALAGLVAFSIWSSDSEHPPL